MYARIEMFSDNIGEEKMGSQGIELSYNDMILLQHSREMADQHKFCGASWNTLQLGYDCILKETY